MRLSPPIDRSRHACQREHALVSDYLDFPTHDACPFTRWLHPRTAPEPLLRLKKGRQAADQRRKSHNNPSVHPSERATLRPHPRHYIAYDPWAPAAARTRPPKPSFATPGTTTFRTRQINITATPSLTAPHRPQHELAMQAPAPRGQVGPGRQSGRPVRSLCAWRVTLQAACRGCRLHFSLVLATIEDTSA